MIVGILYKETGSKEGRVEWGRLSHTFRTTDQTTEGRWLCLGWPAWLDTQVTSDVSHANPSAICILSLDLSLRGSVICILYSTLASISGDRGVFAIDEQNSCWPQSMGFCMSSHGSEPQPACPSSQRPSHSKSPTGWLDPEAHLQRAQKKSLSSVFLEVRAVLACHHGDPRVRQETPNSVLENFDLASLGVP